MGVDICVEDGECSTRIGYGGLQRIRKTLLELTITHLNTINEKKLAAIVKKWIPPPLSQKEMMQQIMGKGMGEGALAFMLSKSGGVDYQAMKAVDGQKLVPVGMAGAYLFVQHSDCDGDWTGANRDAVTAWLKKLMPYVSEDSEDSSEDSKDSEDNKDNEDNKDDGDDGENETQPPPKKRKVQCFQLPPRKKAKPPPVCDIPEGDVNFIKELLEVFSEGTEKDLKVYNC